MDNAKLKEACDLVEAKIRELLGSETSILFSEDYCSYEQGPLAQGGEEATLYALLRSVE